MKRTVKKLAPYIANRINLDDIESSRPLLQYIVENGHVSLSTIAKPLGMSLGACNLHLQRLEHEQLIRRYESTSTGRGRPTVIWGMDDPANLTVCLVFDVPFLHASLADFSMSPILREEHDLSTIASAEDLLAIARSFMERAMNQAKLRNSRIRHALILLPGLMDAVTGVVHNAVNFPILNGLDFNQWVAKEFKLTCSSAPLGLTFYYGESEHLPPDSNNLVLYWDLGLGAVFGRGDKLSSLGADARDGRAILPEIGHVRIHKNGRRCHCGNTGCLEAYVGGWAMVEELDRKTVRGLQDFMRLVMRGDSGALKVARAAAETMGRHLTWPIQVMQTDRIRVCGPLAPIFALVADDFRKGLADMLTDREIERLDTAASPVLEERFHRGAHRLAQRLFTHPRDYRLLPCTPNGLAAAK